MIYKTIITDATVKGVNDAHKVVHRTMHQSDEHKPCPPFMVIGDGMILVQSDYKPASKNAVVAEVPINYKENADAIHLRVRIAAVKLNHEGVEKPLLRDGRIDTSTIKEWVIRRFQAFGLTLIDGSLSVKYAGKIGNESHNMKNCPVADVDGRWTFSSKDLLEKLLITKLGRRNFLGLGMIRLVTQ